MVLMNFLTFFFIIAFSIVTVGSLARKYGKRRYHPIAGTIFNQLLNFSRLHDYMTELASRYKTYRLVTPFRSEVYTSDPANVEYILKTNFDNYGKGWLNNSILQDLLGDGIFTVDGEKWREQRKVSSHEFSARALRDVSSRVFRENAAKLANVVSEAVVSDQPMDMQELFMRSTLDSIFRVAFGSELDSWKEEGARFSRAFDDASEITARRYVDVLWRMKKALNVGLEAKLKENVRVIDEFVYKLVLIHTKKMNDCEEGILWRFVKVSEGDPKYLRDVVLNFVMAGKDTTATTLSWFFYMMCKHPLSQEKAAKEIKQVMIMSSNNIQELSEEALDKMHYLHAALSETLRLYPPVPVNPKMCLSDDTLPDGFDVRRGDVVAYQPYAMGRMRFIWGDDAQHFRPERWLDHKGCFRQESPFKFTAFQGGPRICLGKEFGYRQMKILSAVLLGLFAFRLSDEGKTVNYRTMINLHVDGGLILRAIARSDL
ncbi:cytochrome P450 [Perilla frutescens var. hirtella]|uniref:Cytochrome P450 n=1 Tax=Perilla frutescens var. hirtella TaxID=608512 RepID=A0AAD4JHN8_PERFH|nr:cytochrome P450 [Perilla frutescens var. frutescens]KAH6833313.1 cytochrome P450 [Perilla frutescens var. hirtella]